MSKGQTFEPTYIVRDWSTVSDLFVGAFGLWLFVFWNVEA